MLRIGDKVKVGKTAHRFAGRTGTVSRMCKLIDGYCYVTFDLKPRERTQKTEMMEIDKLLVTEEAPSWEGIKKGSRVRFTGFPEVDGQPVDEFLMGRGGTVIAVNLTRVHRGIALDIAYDREDGTIQGVDDWTVFGTFDEPKWKQYIIPDPAGKLNEIFNQLTDEKMGQETKLEMIPLSKIIESPSNPRREFDETAISELAGSIKEKGVLQPILVRPVGAAYEVVCGARRYRASGIAGRRDIPAVVHDGLSDEEALELQIIENLQRKDVSPMEEAAAFERLMEHHDAEEIALKVGKSARYVAQRMRLNNLIPGFQKLLHMEIFNLKTAFALANLATEDQDEIFDSEFDNRHREFSEMEKGSLSRLLHAAENRSKDLSKAAFDITREDLHPKHGSCLSCVHNSANQPLLFGDGKQVCNHPICFHIKTRNHIEKGIGEAAEDPNKVVVAEMWTIDTDLKKTAAEKEVTILTYQDFEVVQEPEKIPPFAEWIKDHQHEEGDFKDLDEDTKEEYRDMYKEEVSDYEDDMKEYTEQMQSGDLLKAFVAAGYGTRTGKEILVRLKESARKKIEDVPSSDKEEIGAIIAREARAKELDREKVYKSAVDLLDEKSYNEIDAPINALEMTALVLALCDRYHTRDRICKILKIEERDWMQRNLYKAVSENISKELVNLTIRSYLREVMVSATETDPKKYGKAAVITDILKHYYPEDYAKIALEQEEKAIKRGQRVEKRLEELKAKEVINE